MLNKNLLKEEVQDFIATYPHTDFTPLLFQQDVFEGIGNKELVQQLKGRSIAQKKFPFLLKKQILFPPHLNLEQASSQVTAIFKSKDLKGDSFLDLTCGLGIDAFFLSQNFQEVFLVEQNESLLALVAHNWQVLGRKANFYNEQLSVFLARNRQKYSLIYIDPARRDTNNRKQFLLEALSPNILQIQEDLLAISDKVMIKLSPLIDLKYLLSVLKSVQRVDILSVKNEVKEIVVVQNRDLLENEYDVFCRCFNLETTQPSFEFHFSELLVENVSYAEPKTYLYLPNNAVLKSGAFNLIAHKFGLEKLHPNTHLYTSEQHREDFPGRVLKINVINPKTIKKGESYNIISKNYPLSTEAIKKKYKIKEGGVKYLIFTQTIGGKVILQSE
ncbi:THUMP-like domain-containing protein [Capnocytophaga canimorsus]|uniref:THUMP-like domain-containing protein n=1 Tax=Capnocytophaga canimorsus TaxID=28188 RepID=UPI001ACE5B00|nr:RsmD family RNA methyltransferase [Capnocytophaga canimorsus]GIM58376.1 hypothetical protein CAPN007_05830 [Capnocytophaga canimorsus]